MSLEQELQDPKSEKLALLSEMLGSVSVFEVGVYGRRIRDFRKMAWQVQKKMLEMHLYGKWKWVLDGDPEDWINAGLEVFKDRKEQIC